MAADPSLLLPLPRVIAVRGKSHVFQLLDYEVSIMPGVSGVNARKLAQLCGYHGESPLCAVSNRALPRRAPSWTPDARDRGLESWGVHMARGGAGLLPALARVCAERGSKLTFHTLPIPHWLHKEERSILAAALATGCVELVEHADTASFNAYRKEAAGPHVVPMHGQWAAAEPGVAALAESIGAWWRTRPGGGLDVPRAKVPRRGLDVVLPADSGTTALFLSRHAPSDVRIYAVPCNGGGEALMERMKYLDELSGSVGVFPRVLLPPASHTLPFGKVSAQMLGTWRDAVYSGCLLDLQYGPVVSAPGPSTGPPPRTIARARTCVPLRVVLSVVHARCSLPCAQAWAAVAAKGWQLAGEGEAARELLYINTGGHESLPFQLKRYLRAGYLNRYEAEPRSSRHMNSMGRHADKWYAGQWGVDQVLAEAKRVVMVESGLVHTRDAGL